MLRSVAAAHGARFAETLTGFKWIVRAGPGLVYGYEEALGLLRRPGRGPRQGRHRRRGAGLRPRGRRCKAAGPALLDRLDELAIAHGVHATAGLPLRMAPAERDAVVERLRDAPPAGWAADRPGTRRPGAAAPRSERPVVRPSGTEPKLKAYLQVVEPVEGDLAAARAGRGRPLLRTPCAPRSR